MKALFLWSCLTVNIALLTQKRANWSNTHILGALLAPPTRTYSKNSNSCGNFGYDCGNDDGGNSGDDDDGFHIPAATATAVAKLFT